MKKNTVLRIFSLVLIFLLLSTNTAFAANQKDKEDQINSQPIETQIVLRNAFTDKDVKSSFQDFSAEAKHCDLAKNDSNITLGRAVGLVYNQHTGEAIVGAAVYFQELDITVNTDEYGRFELNNILDGIYTISVEADGYLTATYDSMPISSADGAVIFSFAISPYFTIVENYQEDTKTDLQSIPEDISHDDLLGEGSTSDYYNQNIESDAGVALAAYAPPELMSYSVLYKGVVLEFGSNINEYLYYVVPNEMSVTTLNAAQALVANKAQAVAARTYADYGARYAARHPGQGYLLCAETHCQAYTPYRTTESAIQAVNETTNQIMFNDSTNNRVETEFHGTCSGTTTFNGQTMSCTVHPEPKVYAHNRGMCQNGAAAKAKSGWTYSQILNFYYPGVSLVTAYQYSGRGINAGETKLISNAYSVHEFKFAALSGLTYVIESSQASSTTCDTTIEIVDKNGNQVTNGYNDDYNGLYSRVSVTPGAGEYKIIVKKLGGGVFSAMLSVTCNPANVTGGIYVQSLDYDYVDNVIQKVYKFVPTTTKTYTIATYQSTGSPDTYLKLLNSSGVEIQADDDGNGNLFSKIVTSSSLSSGVTYYVVVTTYRYGSPNSSNRYDAGEFSCKLKIN